MSSLRTAADGGRSPAHPQGGILSPLLANIALSVLDEHFTQKWEALGPSWTRIKRRRAGEPVMRLVRYADDFVVMVGGSRNDAEALRDEVAAVLAPMGLRLSAAKTRVCHIDEGFDFLGWRIQRRDRRSRTNKKAVYTYPSKKSLASVVGKVRRLTKRARHRTLSDLLGRLNPGAAGLVQLFPSRSIKTNLRLPGPLRVLAGGRMVEETTPRIEHAHPGPSLPPRMGDQQREDRNVPTKAVRRRAIPLPGHQDSHTMGEHNHNSGMNTWRAGCSGSCTSGSDPNLAGVLCFAWSEGVWWWRVSTTWGGVGGWWWG